MAILGFELEEIVRLVTMLEESGLDELVFKDEEGRYLRVRGPRPQKQAPFPASPPAAPSSSQAPQLPALPAPRRPRKAGQAPAALLEGQVALTSPMVGTFYRAEKPGADPLVEV